MEKGLDKRQIISELVRSPHGDAMAEVFDRHEIEKPDWFQRKREALDREIVHRQRDELERMLAEAEALEESLKTPKQKRAETADRIRELRAKLGK